MDGGGAGQCDETSCQFAHQTGCAAAVDEVDVVGVESAGEGLCGVDVGRGFAGGGAAAG